MKITLDPTEMLAASETLRNCAIEAADIGSQLSACACCAMPADIQPIVEELARTVDRALDSVAAGLSVQAADLTNRAGIATSDSLPAAVSAVDTSTALGSAPGGPAMFTTSIIGGQTLAEPITFGTAPAASSAGLTVSIVGGGAQGDLGFGGPSVDATGLGVSVIGGQQGSVVGGSLGGPSALGVSVIGGSGQSLFDTSMYNYPGGHFQTIGTALPPGAFASGLASNPDPMLGVLAVFGGPAFGQIHLQV